LERDPRDAAAYLLLGQSLSGMKQFEVTLALIEEALAFYSSEARAPAFVEDGEGAEQAFNKAVALAPRDVNPHLALAALHWARGAVPAAERELKKSLTLQPAHPTANRALGLLYLATGRVVEAERPLKRATLVGRDAAPWFTLAQYYIRRQRSDEARSILARLAADKASYAEARARLAMLAYDEGRQADARLYLKEALDRDARSEAAVLVQVRLALRDAQFTAARELLQALLRTHPDSASAHYLMGVVRTAENQSGAAAESFVRAVRLNPLLPGVGTWSTTDSERTITGAEIRKAVREADALGTATTRLARGDAAALDGWLRHGSAATSTAGHAERTPAVVANATRDWQNGRESYVPGITGPPVDPQLRALSAYVSVPGRDFAKAEQELRRTIERDPTRLSAYDRLVQIYIARGRLDDARAVLERQVRLEPQSTATETILGIVLQSQRDYPEAQKHYEAILARDPGAAVAANNLAFIYAETGQDLNRALQLALGAQEVIPDEPNVIDTIGWIYHKQRQPERALAELQRAVAAAPQNPIYHYHLGMAYLASGDAERSRVALEHALTLRRDFPGAKEAERILAGR
jgi:tetratricopeptide (TPR) repeat protein